MRPEFVAPPTVLNNNREGDQILRTIFTAMGAVDAYLIVHVTPYTHPPVLAARLQMTCPGDGLGFEWTDSIWLGLGLECANFEIELRDATGKNRLTWHSTLPSDMAMRNNEPIVSVPKQNWPDDSGHFTEKQVEALRSDYQALVSRSVTYTLEKMDLAPQR